MAGEKDYNLPIFIPLPQYLAYLDTNGIQQ